MHLVKLSAEFAIEIPEHIRKELLLAAGQEFEISVVDRTIQLKPKHSLASLRGIAKGMTWKDDYRDRNDRF